MPERVTIREDLQIIQVDSYGDVTEEDLKGSLDEVMRVHGETGISKVLVDATQETSLPQTFPLFEFGAELAAELLTIQFGVAVSPEVADDLRFLENVTRNRGMNVKMFDSTDAALAWLTGKTSV